MDNVTPAMSPATIVPLGAEGPAPAAHRPRIPALARVHGDLGVYIHFPYCLQKCPYCDFLSVAADPQGIPAAGYGDAVIGELGRRREDVQAGRLRSIFVGGGTPSLWDPRQLGRVLAAVLEAFPGDPAEVTVECNPSSLDSARAQALRAAGATRLSIGVQGLNAERLAFLGRLHDADGALRAVEAALEAGVQVNADLIYGVQGQSAEQAVAEVLRLASMGVHHLSAYALTIEPGTLFGARARQGRLPLCPEDTVADSFLAVESALSAVGFEHYEISNYARGGAYAQHNLGYWRGQDYLGLGCGAFGTVTLASGRLRYRNTPVPERYASSADQWRTTDCWTDGPLLSELEPIDAETALKERILLGLRLAEGVNIEAAAAELGVDAWPPGRKRAAARWIAEGRLQRNGGQLSIPRTSWLLADATIAQLL